MVYVVVFGGEHVVVFCVVYVLVFCGVYVGCLVFGVWWGICLSV